MSYGQLRIFKNGLKNEYPNRFKTVFKMFQRINIYKNTILLFRKGGTQRRIRESYKLSNYQYPTPNNELPNKNPVGIKYR